MILPHYVVTDPIVLTQAILVHSPVKQERAYELSFASCEAGKINDIDPSWLAAVALGETPSLKPTVPGGVCTVVGSGAIVGAGAYLDGVVVGDRAVIGPGNELIRGARVWPGVALGDTSVRFSSDR